MHSLIYEVVKKIRLSNKGFKSVVLNVLFSEGHLKCTVSVDGQIIDYEISVADMLCISSFLKQNKTQMGVVDNGFKVKFIDNTISVDFYFDEEYDASLQ